MSQPLKSTPNTHQPSTGSLPLVDSLTTCPGRDLVQNLISKSFNWSVSVRGVSSFWQSPPNCPRSFSLGPDSARVRCPDREWRLEPDRAPRLDCSHCYGNPDPAVRIAKFRLEIGNDSHLVSKKIKQWRSKN